MHKVDALSYVGEPGETVKLTTKVLRGGEIAITLDGQTVPNLDHTQFPLPSAPGDHRKLKIALGGALGASCVVGIATVDGGTDDDFLLVQVTVEAPVHFYTFSAASPESVAALRAMRSQAASPRRAAKRGNR